MSRMIQTLLVSLACLLASATSSAVPINFVIESDSVPGFSYSLLHSCDKPSCMGGSNLGSLSGTLSGHLEDGKLLNLSGVVDVGGPTNQSFNVTGFFDFTPGGAGGELIFDGLGDFVFANSLMAGPANSFDGENLYAWGGIERPNDWGYSLGMDLGGRVITAAVPEPSAALLFGLGAVVISGRIRR